MNNETLLRRLESVKAQGIYGNELLALISDVKTELLTANMKLTDKQRFKHCLDLCNKGVNSSRPVLAFTHYEDGNQYFTNSWFAVELHGDDIMKDLPRHDEPYQFKYHTHTEEDAKRLEYPNIKQVFNVAGTEFEIDFEKLYKFARVNKNVETMMFDFNGNISKVDIKLLLNALTWGNASKGTGTISYRGSEMKPIEIVKSNGTRIVVCPVRCEKEVSEELTFKFRG